MAYNQTVTLTGNMGAEAQIIEQEGKPFASFSIATTDSYQDKTEQWQQKETVWHDVLVFSPHVLQQVKSLKKGTRIELVGSLSYRQFPCVLEDGRTIQKKEATIIGHKLELKPLVKKST